VVEQRLGRVRWLALFVVGAVVGEIAGYAWDPTGAGASVALCGLMAGLVGLQLAERELVVVPSIYVLGVVSIWTCSALAAVAGADETTAIIAAAVLCAVLVNVLLVARNRVRDPRFAPLVVAAVVTLSGILLTGAQDLHGAALLGGLAASAVLFAPGRWFQPEARASA
jgi:membrane associated rhomboid family serine protease